MAQKIRIGIELNHVIRNINRQLAKYYQKEYDAPIDLDTLDYTRDILKEVCKFKSDKEKVEFIYENYPLEIFGMANEVDQMISRDLNIWIKQLENFEQYDVEVFFYSLKEVDITISSTYYFLSKIASRVRKIVFPKDVYELMEYGDVFITANQMLITCADKNKVTVAISLPLNNNQEGDITYTSFKEFLKDTDKLGNIIMNFKRKTGCKDKQNWFSTWMQSAISYLQRKVDK